MQASADPAAIASAVRRGIEALAENGDIASRMGLATSRSVPGAVLASLAARVSTAVQEAVAAHPATPHDQLRTLARSRGWPLPAAGPSDRLRVPAVLLRDPRLAARAVADAAVTELAGAGSRWVGPSVFNRLLTPAQVRSGLSRPDGQPPGMRAAVGVLAGPDQLELALAGADPAIRIGAAANRLVTGEPNGSNSSTIPTVTSPRLPPHASSWPCAGSADSRAS